MSESEQHCPYHENPHEAANRAEIRRKLGRGFAKVTEAALEYLDESGLQISRDLEVRRGFYGGEVLFDPNSPLNNAQGRFNSLIELGARTTYSSDDLSFLRMPVGSGLGEPITEKLALATTSLVETFEIDKIKRRAEEVAFQDPLLFVNHTFQGRENQDPLAGLLLSLQQGIVTIGGAHVLLQPEQMGRDQEEELKILQHLSKHDMVTAFARRLGSGVVSRLVGNGRYIEKPLTHSRAGEGERELVFSEGMSTFIDATFKESQKRTKEKHKTNVGNPASLEDPLLHQEAGGGVRCPAADRGGTIWQLSQQITNGVIDQM